MTLSDGAIMNILALSINLVSLTFRYEQLISKGLNTMSGEEVLELNCKLSAEEQRLFEGGRASILAMQRWLQRDKSDQRIKASTKRPAPVNAQGSGQENKQQRQ